MPPKGYSKGNAIEIVDDNTVGIVIVRKNGDRHVALVDKHLYYEKNLGSMTFSVSDSRNLYVKTCAPHPDGGFLEDGRKRKTRISLHHMILPREDGKQTDHKDGSPLNNRLDNLENVTPKQNSQNQGKRQTGRPPSSKYVGVCWVGKSQAWSARILNSETKTNQIHLGFFRCEEEAARTYDRAVVKYREIRVPERQLNFPENLEIYRQELRDDPGWPHDRQLSSRYKGVSWCKPREDWRSAIKINYKSKHLAYFTCEEEAARRYDKAVVKYREITDAENQLNFPENLEQYRQELRDEENITLWTSMAKEGDLQGLLFGGL